MEVCRIIYDFALSDYSNDPNQDQPIRRDQLWGTPCRTPDIAFKPLLTCRKI